MFLASLRPCRNVKCHQGTFHSSSHLLPFRPARGFSRRPRPLPLPSSLCVKIIKSCDAEASWRRLRDGDMRPPVVCHLLLLLCVLLVLLAWRTERPGGRRWYPCEAGSIKHDGRAGLPTCSRSAGLLQRFRRKVSCAVEVEPVL